MLGTRHVCGLLHPAPRRFPLNVQRMSLTANEHKSWSHKKFISMIYLAPHLRIVMSIHSHLHPKHVKNIRSFRAPRSNRHGGHVYCHCRGLAIRSPVATGYYSLLSEERGSTVWRCPARTSRSFGLTRGSSNTLPFWSMPFGSQVKRPRR